MISKNILLVKQYFAEENSPVKTENSPSKFQSTETLPRSQSIELSNVSKSNGSLSSSTIKTDAYFSCPEVPPSNSESDSNHSYQGYVTGKFDLYAYE